MSRSLLITNARAVTLAGPTSPRTGPALQDLAILPRADILIENGLIASISPSPLPTPHSPPPSSTIDAAGRVLLPAFIDCHSHACWAGDRIDEWQRKLRGVPYLEILKSGGGIMSTVRAVRAASESQLRELLDLRLNAMLRCGSATVEVKSGYGLSTAAELKMLRVIRTAADHAARSTGQTVIPTALLGHAIDPDIPNFVDTVINETLPAVHAEFPGITIDAFCEQGAWSLADCLRLFDRALSLGHPLRIHADQFNSLGMIPEAIRRHARSVDHLEASTEADLDLLAASDSFGVILPACGFHVDGRYAKVRRFLDRGGKLALATNYNPGSAPTPSIPFAMALAARHGGLSIPETFHAAISNPANLLNLSDRAQITPGMRADLLLLRTTDERSLAYEVGHSPIDSIFIAGRPL
ncbi:MAG: imidazolonepropionase [Phycisphaeraceae bacterium]|nr:imidazolonepropionase [Phycisphaeraceae bacterium]